MPQITQSNVGITQTTQKRSQGQIEGYNSILTGGEIRQYVVNQAKLANVSVEDVLWILDHESQDGKNMRGDDGQSRGYFMISSVYHPEISDACADSLPCSTAWTLNEIKQGRINEWSTWKFRFKWYPNENPPQ
jgi:hypothetical protein